jgi:hypothetical protein
MTEAELVEIVIGYASGGAVYFTIWLTILSAYAVTAYFTGNSLTTLQIVWLNTLYLFGALLAITGFYDCFISQLYYLDQLIKLNPESPQIMGSEILFSVTAFAVVGTFATLVFMWQVRHPKTE